MHLLVQNLHVSEKGGNAYPSGPIAHTIIIIIHHYYNYAIETRLRTAVPLPTGPQTGLQVPPSTIPRLWWEYMWDSNMYSHMCVIPHVFPHVYPRLR
jgi:hypothetical protein